MDQYSCSRGDGGDEFVELYEYHRLSVVVAAVQCGTESCALSVSAARAFGDCSFFFEVSGANMRFCANRWLYVALQGFWLGTRELAAIGDVFALDCDFRACSQESLPPGGWAISVAGAKAEGRHRMEDEINEYS
jgi:hypothetical protein